MSPETVCKSTLYPKLCRSILSTYGSYTDLYNYGKFSIKQSIKQAKRSTAMIDRYLNRKSTMLHTETGAIEDCHQLSELNAYYLDLISGELDLSNDVDRVKSLLSAIVTNQQTCFDGLEMSRSNLMGALYAPLSNDTELYSVSLALVSRALGRGKKKGKKSVVTRSLIAESGEEPYWSPVPMKSWINFPTSRRRLFEVYSANLTVASDGTGNFTSITDAVAFAPNNSIAGAGYFVIHVKEGIYRENIIVSKNKKYIMMIGEGINRTVITGNRSFVDGWTTYSSATFAVIGEGFVAINMTFQNTAGPEKHQAVAVRNNADQSTFFRCSFEGYQDTLYAHSLRQFYRECDIYGTVDFIFGNAASVFQECNLYARKPLPNQKIAFTAQGRTDPNQNTGFSIHNSSIKASPELLSDMNSTQSFLGRPWKVYSRTVYMQSFLDNVIDPSGWLEWNGTAGLDTLFYGEFQNTGPGSNTSLRVNWTGVVFMDSMEAMNFTVSNLTDGSNWLPSINVPFSSGLL